jgi:RND family efflux transporter MFP subunit
MKCRAALAIVTAVLLGCAKAPREAADEGILTAANAAPPVEEVTAVVTRGTVSREMRFLGIVKPVDEQALYFRASGRIWTIAIKESERVRAGQVLAELEMLDLQHQIDQARIALQQIRARMASTRQRSRDLEAATIRYQIRQYELEQEKARDLSVDVAIALTNVEKAELAVDDARLAGKLQPEHDASQALTRAQLDLVIARQNHAAALQAKTAHDWLVKSLEREVALAGVEVERMKDPDDAAAEADLARADLTLRQLEERAAFYRIVAPIAGTVMSVASVAGAEIDAYETVVIVADPSRLDVSVDLGPEELVRLSVGQEVQIGTDDAGGQPVLGRIRRIPYAAPEQTSAASADRTTRIDFVGPRPPRVKSGDPVRVTVVLERRRDVLLVPKNMVRTFQGRTFAVVIDGDVRRRVQLKLGLEGEDDVEVVSGLQEGERVVSQ